MIFANFGSGARFYNVIVILPTVVLLPAHHFLGNGDDERSHWQHVSHTFINNFLKLMIGTDHHNTILIPMYFVIALLLIRVVGSSIPLIKGVVKWMSCM